MSISNNFIKGVFLGVGGMGLRTALNIIIMPLIIKFLGVEEYGFYLFLLSFIDMLIMIDAGLNTGLVNRLSVYGSQQDDVKIKEQLSIGFWLYLAMSILMYGVGVPFLPHMTSWFHLSPALQALSEPAHHIILITGALSLFGNYYQSIVLANHRYHWVQIADLIYLVGSNIAAVILLFMGYGLIEILAARLAILLVRLVFLVYWAGHIDPFAILPPLRFKWDALKELFSVSMFSLLLGISGIFAMRIDNMVIAANLTMVEVAVFGIVFRLYNMVSEVIDKLTVGLMPLLSKYFSENNLDVTRKIYVRGTALIQFAACMLLTWVTAYYEPIFGYFSHGEIPIDPTRNLMLVVIVIIWSRCIVRPASNYLFVFNQRVLVISASIGSTILNIILSLALVKSFGVVGVALGTMIPMLLEHHLALILQSTVKQEISIWSFIKQVYIDTLPALLACAGVIQLVKMQNITTGYLYVDMFIVGGSAFVVGGLVWLLTATTQEEKQLLLERVAPKLVRVGIRFPGLTSGTVTAVEE